MRYRIFVTDCEGPISKNDNAFELSSEFISDGERLFTQLSRYDDVQAEIFNREGYNAGDTLKLIVPFLKAYDVTSRDITEFSAKTILVMPNAKEALQALREHIPSFIVSTSYGQYIEALCEVLEFPFENTYHTKLDIDNFPMNNQEQRRIKQLADEVCSMPPIEVPEGAKSVQDLSEQSNRSITRISEIFWSEIAEMQLGRKFSSMNPMGGTQKARAVTNITNDAGSSIDRVMYVGDSITDVECLRLVKKSRGLTISFNGNAYAVKGAEIAVLSHTSLPIAILGLIFSKFGRDSTLKLGRQMEQDGIRKVVQESNLDPALKHGIRELSPKYLPQVRLITPENIREIIDSSCLFRKLVRGAKVGNLG